MGEVNFTRNRDPAILSAPGAILMTWLVLWTCTILVVKPRNTLPSSPASFFTPRPAPTSNSSDPAGDEWPMFRGALNHTGESHTTPIGNLSQLWNYTTNLDGIFSSPTMSGGRVYVGSTDHDIYCMDAISGTLLWRYATNDSIYSTPAIANGYVYIGSDDNTTYCLNTTSGLPAWNYTTGGHVVSSPAVAGGLVYFGSLDSKIYCLNAANGSLVWNQTLSSSITTSPAIAGHQVFFATNDELVYCLDAATGTMQWNYSVGGYHELYSPVLASGHVYVGGIWGNLFCLDASTGQLLWSYTGITSGPPAVTSGRAYVCSMDGKLYCLNADNGTLLWNDSILGNDWQFFSLTDPAVAGNLAYVGTEEQFINGQLTDLPINQMYCIDAGTGNLLWNYTMQAGIASSPAVAMGRVYVGCGDSVSCLPMAMAPLSPQGIHVIPGEDLVRITWQPGGNGGADINLYHIFRNGVLFATVNGNNTSYEDTNVTAWEIYSYAVSAVNSVGEGQKSDSQSASPSAWLQLLYIITVITSASISISTIGVWKSRKPIYAYLGGIAGLFTTIGIGGVYIATYAPLTLGALAEYGALWSDAVIATIAVLVLVYLFTLEYLRRKVAGRRSKINILSATSVSLGSYILITWASYSAYPIWNYANFESIFIELVQLYLASCGVFFINFALYTWKSKTPEIRQPNKEFQGLFYISIPILNTLFAIGIILGRFMLLSNAILLTINFITLEISLLNFIIGYNHPRRIYGYKVWNAVEEDIKLALDNELDSMQHVDWEKDIKIKTHWGSQVTIKFEPKRDVQDELQLFHAIEERLRILPSRDIKSSHRGLRNEAIACFLGACFMFLFVFIIAIFSTV